MGPNFEIPSKVDFQESMNQWISLLASEIGAIVRHAY